MCWSAAAIIVSWECPIENGTPVTGYTLEWKVDGQFTELHCGPDRTYEVLRKIKPVSRYDFRVKALSAAGPSPWSAVSTCQTPAAPPSAVTSLKAVQRSSSQVRLRWRHPETNGAPITSYNLKVAGCKNISFDVITGKRSGFDEKTAVIQEYAISELRPNTPYRISVQAVNKIGCGPFSSDVFASTSVLPPPAPLPPAPLPPAPLPPPLPAQPPNTVKGLKAESTTASAVKVRWEPVTAVRKGESIEYILQIQCVGRDQDFLQMYQVKTHFYEFVFPPNVSEVRFQVCAVRLMNPPSESAGPLKGEFSPVMSYKKPIPTPIQKSEIYRLLDKENEVLQFWRRVKMTRELEIYKRYTSPPIYKAIMILKNVPYRDAIDLIADWDKRAILDKRFDDVTIVDPMADFKVIKCSQKEKNQCVVLASLDREEEEPYYAWAWKEFYHPGVPGEDLKVTVMRLENEICGAIVRPYHDATKSCKITIITREAVPSPLNITYLSSNPSEWLMWLKEHHSYKVKGAVAKEDNEKMSDDASFASSKSDGNQE